MFDGDKGERKPSEQSKVGGGQEIAVPAEGLVELWNVRLESREGQNHGRHEMLAHGV